jgi:hypothetical protein
MSKRFKLPSFFADFRKLAFYPEGLYFKRLIVSKSTRSNFCFNLHTLILWQRIFHNYNLTPYKDTYTVYNPNGDLIILDSEIVITGKKITNILILSFFLK